MTRDITVVGPLNIDLLIVGDGPPSWDVIPGWDGPADMEMTAAGSVGYNVSDLAKLGLDVAVVSCVPDDPLGAFIIHALQDDGVDTSEVCRVPDSLCGIGVYMLLFDSRKRPLVYRLPTHEPWPQSFDDAQIEELLDARLLHNGGYLHFKSAWNGITTRLFKDAKARGLTTSMDPQFPLFAMDPPWITPLEEVLPYIDYFFCDETEARNLVGSDDLESCAQSLLDAGPQSIIIKQGAEGASAYRPGWSHHQAAIESGEVVDSIGAGDAFDAGFLYGILADWPVEKCMKFAASMAGHTVTGVGGSSTFPSRKQIEEIIQTL